MTAASVVVPVLDDAAALRTLIEDLRREPDLEVVVVDGGSADASLAVAAELADQAHSGPRGRGAQLRVGAQAAQGDWLWFLHADSRAGPELLTAFRDARSGPPGWGFCAVELCAERTAWRTRAGASELEQQLHRDAGGWLLEVIGAAMNVRSWLTGIATGDQGIFVHRNLLDAIGGIPEQPLMEDIECCRRLRRLGRPQRIRAPLGASARRWQQQGALRTMALMWSLRLRYFLGADPATLARRYYPEHAES